MFSVRKAQLEAMVEAHRSLLVEQAVAQIERLWPAVHRAAEPASLHARVHRILCAGMDLGLTEESALLRYLNVALALGDDFANDPALPEAQAVVRGAFTPGRKIDELVKIARSELRRRAV
jgi:hypothetical protein